ncbi:golvesin C-terminal-like domain-containing protein [Paenibacillus chungangensis]|uniref:S-layer homology domain-containing protein n=1 Tax=Paenibacillus chungangensis TaxID=696535 RepID=A0ABW3HXJ2_9BACL
MDKKMRTSISIVLAFLLIAQAISLKAHAEQGIAEAATIIIDYGASAYSETGVWADSGLPGHDGAPSRYAYTAGDTARWTPDLTEGVYRVSVYKIVDAASGDPAAAIEVIHAGGTDSVTIDHTIGTPGWQELGTYSFLGGTGGYVAYTLITDGLYGRTDAVKFERINIPIIVDNGDPGYTEFGTWSDSSLPGYNNSGTRYSGSPDAYAQWTPTLANAGTYRVSIYKPVHANSDPAAQVDVVGAFGTTTFNLDYTSEPSGWVSLGEHYFAGGSSGYVRNTLASAGTAVRADAVKFERVEAAPTAMLDDSLNPDEAAVNAPITVSFSTYMDTGTLTAQHFELKRVDDESAVELAAEVKDAGRKVMLHPYTSLSYDTAYTLTIGPEVKDLAGTSLTGVTEWTLHTEQQDVTPPSVSISVPLMNVLETVSSPLIVSFNEPMNLETLTSDNMMLQETATGNAVPYEGSVGSDHMSYRLQPSAHLNYDTAYKLTMKAGLTDRAGNPLPEAIFHFTTAPASNAVNELYVSPSGDDANPGTLAAPFATIDRARQEVRQLNGNMQDDITVHIADGTYPISETLQFGTPDSGSNGYVVTYKAEEGAAPVITGGVPLTGWQQAGAGPLWKADAGDMSFRQLYVNGERAQRAASAETYDAIRMNDEENGFIIDDSVIGQWGNADSIEFVWNKSWRHHRLIVDTISAGSQQGEWNVIFKQPYFDWARTSGFLTFGPDATDFYIENALELLDTPGEWYLDESSGEVYYYPLPDEDMSAAEAIAPQLETLLEFRGTLGQPVHHLAFHGLTFRHGSWMRPSEQGLSAIQGDIIASGVNQTGGSHQGEKVIGNVLVHAGENITLERNRWEHMGAAGLVLENGATDNQIIGNIFTDISASGIIIGDMKDAYPEDPRQVNSGNKVENNVIYDIGTEYWNSIGIFALYVDHTEILHNEMYDFPYSGISLGWGWGAHQESGILKNNRVEGNHIHHGMYGLNDGGAVYLLGKQPGTTIARNLVHDNHNLYGGIYLDTGSEQLTVTENMTYSVPLGIISPYLLHHDSDPNLDPNNAFSNNYFGVRPDEAEYPAEIAAEAGLEPAYHDLLVGLPAPEVPSVTIPDDDEMSVIVAIGQSGYTEEGEWATSGILGYDEQSLTRYSVSLDASVTFRPELQSGVYRVYLYKLVHPSSDPNAKVEVVSAGGTTESAVDQTTGEAGWVDLGEHTFNAGTAGYVKLSRMTSPEDNSFGYLRASAVKFEKISDISPPTEPEQPTNPEQPTEPEQPTSEQPTSEQPEASETEEDTDNGSGFEADSESESSGEDHAICASQADACGGWAEQHVVKLMKAGWMKGFPDGTVKPDKRMTRAEMATLLVRALNLSPMEESRFSDVNDHWAKESIEAAAAHDIMHGVAEDQFHPDEMLTREQLAVLVVRAFKLVKYADALDTATVSFLDSDNVSPWASDAIALLYRLDIVSGYPDGTFKPKRGASRAEVAYLLSKIIELIPGEEKGT